MEIHRSEPATDTAKKPSRAEASALVAACEVAWHAIQRRHPDVPDVVIVLGSGVERGRLVKLGHWWGARWIADGNVRGEVLLAGEALHLPAEAVLEVLLHEAAHGVNAARGIQDASRGGRYHNRRFKTTAEELGLVVDTMPPYGWARTSIGPHTRPRYENEISQLGAAMRIARRVGADVRLGADAEHDGDRRGRDIDEKRTRDRKQPAICGCGRRLRMAPSVLAQGPVLCGICREPFAIGRAVQASLSRRPELADASDNNTGRRYISPVQREGLATLVEIGTSPNGALLLTETGAWYADRKQGRERALAIAVDADVDAANKAARAMLKLDGTLRERPIVVSRRELMTGDLVVVAATDSRVVDVNGVELPPPGVFGTVERADSDRKEITINFATSGRHTIAADSPAGAALAYGYVEGRCANEPLLGNAPQLRLQRIDVPRPELGLEFL